MELVIKILDKDYKKLQDGHISFNVLEVLRNGKPLPKGYGRLIDTKKIIVKPEYMQSCMGEVVIRAEDLARIIAEVPTIIEADKDR